MAFDRTLIVIRERLQIDVIDLALAVVRRRPQPLLLATLAGVLPFAALNAWLCARSSEQAPVLGLVLWWFEAPLAFAPLTVVLGSLMFDRASTVGSVARSVVSAAGPLLLTTVVLRFIPLYWLPPRLVFANEVILLERAKAGKLWRRGAELTRDREADLFLLALLQVGVVWIIALVGSVALGRLGATALAEEMTWDIPRSANLAGPLIQTLIWLGAAFLVVVRFLTYIDQRIRLEGWEVELRLRAAGEAMAEGRRWT